MDNGHEQPTIAVSKRRRQHIILTIAELNCTQQHYQLYFDEQQTNYNLLSHFKTSKILDTTVVLTRSGTVD